MEGLHKVHDNKKEEFLGRFTGLPSALKGSLFHLASEIRVHPAIDGISGAIECGCFGTPHHADCLRQVGV